MVWPVRFWLYHFHFLGGVESVYRVLLLIVVVRFYLSTMIFYKLCMEDASIHGSPIEWSIPVVTLARWSHFASE